MGLHGGVDAVGGRQQDVLATVGFVARAVSLHVHLVGDVEQRLSVLDRASALVRDVPHAQPQQILDRCPVAEQRQPRVEVALHAVLEGDRAVGVASLGLLEATARIPVQEVVGGRRLHDAGNVGGIDDHGALRLEHGDDVVHRRLLRGRESTARRAAAAGRRNRGLVEERARNADAGALELVGPQERGVVVARRRGAHLRGGIVGIGRRAFQRAQHDRRVAHRARHRSGGVLIGGDRNHAVPAHASHRGLDTHEEVLLRRTENGTRRFGTHVAGPEAHVGAHTGARATRVHHGAPIEERLARITPRVPRIHAVAGEPRVVAGHAAGGPVGELGELCLGDDDRPGRLEVARDRGVVVRHQVGEGERPTGRRHLHRLDVVLERDRDAVQRPTNAPRSALAIERIGDRQRLRVHRDHGVEFVFVRRNAGEILLHDLTRRGALLFERGAQVGETGFDDGYGALNGRTLGPEKTGTAQERRHGGEGHPGEPGARKGGERRHAPKWRRIGPASIADPGRTSGGARQSARTSSPIACTSDSACCMSMMAPLSRTRAGSSALRSLPRKSQSVKSAPSKSAPERSASRIEPS